MTTLYEVYTSDLESLNVGDPLTGSPVEVLLRALFIQYVDRKEEFFKLAQERYNLALYPEELERDHEVVAIRLASWAVAFGYVNELIEALPRKIDADNLRRELVGRDTAGTIGVLFSELRLTFPYYGNEDFKAAQQLFEEKFLIHIDEEVTRFMRQVYETIKKVRELRRSDELIQLALHNHQLMKNR